MQNLLADIILPIAIDTIYSYKVPEQMQDTLKVGMRVNVYLMYKKYVGIVLNIHDNIIEDIKYKEINSVIDETPIVSETGLKFWQWISQYYMCTLGEVYKAALPNEISKNTYKQKHESYIRLGLTATQDIKLTAKQKLLYDDFTFLLEQGQVPKSKLLENHSTAVFSALIKKQILEVYQTDKTRVELADIKTQISELSAAQQTAYNQIKDNFKIGKNVLLHGVTSSGKTEIYIKLISDVLKRGGQVLYLLPEIALTSQLTMRLQAVFGDNLVTYHSKLSDSQRAEIYNEIQSGSRFKIALGVRSAIFLPFNYLQLVIVDEEHESSYKQYEPAPRYNARDASLYMAMLTNANVLLGSATPSIESYTNAINKKYALVELNQRFNNTPLPQISVIDKQLYFKQNRMKSMFSQTLIDKMSEAFANNKQVILFQNRRGYSSFVECQSCGWVPKCNNCDISLNYHKTTESLSCHYCGSSEPIQISCPKCGSENIKNKGFGTEKVVDELLKIFNDISVERLDIDSTQNKNSASKIIENFATGKTQVLVGTQMLAKGLDFDNVSLVGILNADNLLNYPDFRAYERSYQLLVQVAGRSGRRDGIGDVILQTSQVENPVVLSVLQNNYNLYYNEQIKERELFLYPPFVRLINIYVKHKNEDYVNSAMTLLANSLRTIYGENLLGPDDALVPKIQKLYIKMLVLKFKRTENITTNKQKILSIIKQIKHQFKGIIIVCDVDPA